MRNFVMRLLLASCYAAPAVAQTCAQPGEQQAFNVIALKSSLMVGALSCNQAIQYDQFMTRFEPHILAEQHVIDGYFGHADGLYSQMQEDSYTTTLANSESQASISAGPDFCNASADLFTTVLAMKNADALDAFVDEHRPAQPINIVACPGSVAVPRPVQDAPRLPHAAIIASALPPPKGMAPHVQHVQTPPRRELAQASHKAVKKPAASDIQLATLSI